MSILGSRRRLIHERSHGASEIAAGILYMLIVAGVVAVPLAQISLSMDVLNHDGVGEAAFRAERMQAITVLGILLLGLVCIWVVFTAIRTHALAGPLVRLTRHIHDLSAGRLNERIDVRAHDELQALADAMNSMTDGLQERDNTIKEGILNQIQLAQATLKASDSSERAARALERLARSVEHAYEQPDPALNKAVENLLRS